MIGNTIMSLLPASLRARWGLNLHELDFVRVTSASRSVSADARGSRVLIQMPADYYILTLFALACDQLRPSVVEGLWHQSITSAPRGETFQLARGLGRRFFNWLDQSKWHTLYASIGAEYASSLSVGFAIALRHRVQAHLIWKSLEGKDELLALRLRGLHVGDLVYDTYLRYRVQPTVDLKDPFLRSLIAKALDAQTAVRHVLKKGKYDRFLTSYTSYIQHGIPAREALRLGVQVYSAGNLSQFFKRLDITDSLHTAAHWCYRYDFEKLPDQNTARRIAQDMLEQRFSGGVDKATLYMKSSAFGESEGQMPNGIEGIVFLHDFFDSPHCHRSMLFADFLEWADHTLGLIEKHGLAFAVKPHPNQLPESSEVVIRLQRKYPSVHWLSPNLSNRTIFASGIKCGVSVYGTILHELAYHGIPALAAGDHPHTAFRIAITPNTVDEYSRMLLNYSELKLDPDVKNEVLAFYYMHNLHASEGLPLQLADKGLREIRASDSVSLARFMAQHPQFPKLDLPENMAT